MNKEAIYHRPKGNYAYAYDANTLHIRIRTKKDDIKSIELLWGDKYDWTGTKRSSTMSTFASDSMFDYWQIAITPPTRRTRYAFQLTAHKSPQVLWLTERDFTSKEPLHPDDFFDFPFLHPNDSLDIPDWAKDAVFYQIFPERFANGNPAISPQNVQRWGEKPEVDNFFGGDLQGIIDHLDYLEQLGITAIYLTPIFEATSNHKYDTIDYKKIDPHFGTLETMKDLVKKCHERGIRVVLDAVFNHSGLHFGPFLDVLEKGKASRFKDWFHIHSFPIVTKPTPSYDCFSFYPGMPKLNTQNPNVKQMLLDIAHYWLVEADIDGWRLDVANEIDHDFWRDFRKVVKKAKPDALILGEIWHDSLPWLQGDQFDTVMNYLFTNAVLDFFAKETTSDVVQLDEQLGRIRAMYPEQVTEAMLNVLDSHDTARLLTLCKEDKEKMKLAAFFLFTYPGTPCIYYGDEIGLTGQNDPDCRKTMIWDEQKQDLDMLTFYKQIISLRHELAPLRRGDFQMLHAKPHQQSYVFSRTYADETVYVAINRSAKPVTLQLTLNPTSVLTNKMDGSISTANKHGIVSILLNGYGYAIYT